MYVTVRCIGSVGSEGAIGNVDDCVCGWLGGRVLAI